MQHNSFTIYDLRFESEAHAREFGEADAKRCDETVRGIGSKGAGGGKMPPMYKTPDGPVQGARVSGQ